MSSPSTKRDQRREARRAQFLQQQEQRRRARERARRVQLTRRIALVAVPVLVIGLLVWGVIAHFTTASSPTTPAPRHTPTGTNTHPATGQVVDGISCTSSAGTAERFHTQLYVYVNGQSQQIPANVGLPSSHCVYAVHAQGASGIIAVESPDHSSYVLGNLFDIWGQPLSTTNVMGHQVDSTHKLVMDVYDASGKMSVYTGNPLDLKLQAHETVYLLYNSPHVRTAAFTQWNGL
jgi:hypothetical protein